MTGDEPTVLLVDDEEDVVEVYALALGDDYDLRRAYSGEEALERIDETVDVVLLDRRMPGLSGREVLEEIRRRGLATRVAMVTAVDPDLDVAEMPFDSYVTKPVDDEQLRGVVEDLLALSEYDSLVQELASVVERQAVLETEMTRRELDESEEYQALQERAAELKAEIDGEVYEELFDRAISGLRVGPADDT